MSETPRAALVRQLRSAVGDERVLAAIGELPRERFMPKAQREHAYENIALPIDCEQTISQPLVVARMLELLELRETDRVLDVGTGSGYHAALLARLAGHVWTIERHPELTARAQLVLDELGFTNISCVVGDGAAGFPEAAPFDAINVAAGAPAPPPALEQQLAPGGRLVVPVGAEKQHLVLVRRGDHGLVREQHEPVRFVPLISPPPGPADRA